MPKILIGNIKGPQGAQGIQGPQGPVGATGPQGPMPDLINNALATEAGVAALDAAMGKTLQDQLTELNSNFQRNNFYGTILFNAGDFGHAIQFANTDGSVYSLAFDDNTISLDIYKDGTWVRTWTK